jgi:two-component system nitrate/nitrite response regulator NarL
MPDPIRAAVVDDHPLFREGVTKLLARTPGVEIVADGSTASEAIAIAQRFLPDIMLLDLKLPGSGIEAATTIAREFAAVRILILTASDRDEDVATMLELGARGYLLKGCTGQEIVRAVQGVCNGEFYVTPALAARVTQRSKPAPIAAEEAEEELTNREAIILAQVTKGMTNKEIARELNLREKTVKHYMTNIMQKLNVRNRLEAALMGQKRQQSSSTLAN